MNLKSLVELFKCFSPVTQVAMIGFALAVIVLLVFCPTAGTGIIAFLVALKMLLRQ
jgi:hypothetical protein